MKLPEIKPKQPSTSQPKVKLTRKERFEKAKKMTHVLSQLDNAFSDAK